MIYGEILGHVEFNLGWWPLPDGEWGTTIMVVISIMFGTVLFNLLKGKFGIAALVFTIPAFGLILSCIGAVRLAKPRSVWARYLYDRNTMAKAIERHEPPIDLEKYPRPKLRRGYSAPQSPTPSAD